MGNEVKQKYKRFSVHAVFNQCRTQHVYTQESHGIVVTIIIIMKNALRGCKLSKISGGLHTYVCK